MSIGARMATVDSEDQVGGRKEFAVGAEFERIVEKYGKVKKPHLSRNAKDGHARNRRIPFKTPIH